MSSLESYPAPTTSSKPKSELAKTHQEAVSKEDLVKQILKSTTRNRTEAEAMVAGLGDSTR